MRRPLLRFIIAVLLLSGCCVRESHADEVKPRPVNVSLVSLIAAPEKYADKLVRVTGFLHVRYEDYALFLTREDANYQNSLNAAKLRFSTTLCKTNPRVELKECDGHYVDITATVVPQEDNFRIYSLSLYNVLSVRVRTKYNDD